MKRSCSSRCLQARWASAHSASLRRPAPFLAKAAVVQRTNPQQRCHSQISKAIPSPKSKMRLNPMPTLSLRPERHSKTGVIFSDDDVPPVEQWARTLKVMRLNDLTPEACFKATAVYCLTASYKNVTWKTELMTSKSLAIFSSSPLSRYYHSTPKAQLRRASAGP